MKFPSCCSRELHTQNPVQQLTACRYTTGILLGTTRKKKHCCCFLCGVLTTQVFAHFVQVHLQSETSNRNFPRRVTFILLLPLGGSFFFPTASKKPTQAGAQVHRREAQFRDIRCNYGYLKTRMLSRNHAIEIAQTDRLSRSLQVPFAYTLQMHQEWQNCASRSH